MGCILCGAPGGYPYCSAECEIADNPDDNGYGDEEAE